jgi:hypothetical protein
MEDKTAAVPRVQTVAQHTFKGTAPEMNGHVYQCYGEATEKNQLARTMEELNGYVGLHFKHNPADIKRMIELREDITIAMPKGYDDQATKTAIRIWEMEVDMFIKRKETYNNNKCALYSIVWGQVPRPCKQKSNRMTPTKTCTKTATAWG